MTLQAFHNNSQLQQEFLDRAQGHYDADNLIELLKRKYENSC